ncbi:MAG TPA: MBL fold metallo-hydrolase [Dermatophilaceae bacterium]|jgi:metallo-beta-lactamase family protein
MAATLTFLGAAGTVTGSKFLLEHDHRRTMVDCGLYQGERTWRRLNWEPLPVSASSISDVVLTHAHLDHCGHLPALVREGFTGPTWCTQGTAALAAIVLRDSAYLQEEDAERARLWGFSRHDPPLPLYNAADAERAIASFSPTDYHQDVQLSSGARLSLRRAGHILGSASALVTIDGSTVLFSGDLGRTRHPLLLAREDPPAARTVVIESTYGDRAHPAEGSASHEVLAQAIRRTVKRGGSVLIPAFAVDRTELVLQALSKLSAAGEIPAVPVFVDSPMALAALDVYRSSSVRQDLRPDLPARLVNLPNLHTAHSAQESMQLNDPRTPSIIISASGMATGGRVVHHLMHLLPDPRHTVILTGYQAVGTRGRVLAEGATELKMFGRYVPVRAEVVVDHGFSVHADATELLTWLRALPEAPETVYIVHGEPRSARALAATVRAETGWCAVVPELGERVRVG